MGEGEGEGAKCSVNPPLPPIHSIVEHESIKARNASDVEWMGDGVRRGEGLRIRVAVEQRRSGSF